MGPIPWSILDRFARQRCTSDVELEDFIFYIRALDNTFMLIKNEEQNKKPR